VSEYSLEQLLDIVRMARDRVSPEEVGKYDALFLAIQDARRYRAWVEATIKFEAEDSGGKPDFVFAFIGYFFQVWVRGQQPSHIKTYNTIDDALDALIAEKEKANG